MVARSFYALTPTETLKNTGVSANNEQYKCAAALLFIVHCSLFIIHCGLSRIFVFH